MIDDITADDAVKLSDSARANIVANELKEVFQYIRLAAKRGECQTSHIYGSGISSVWLEDELKQRGFNVERLREDGRPPLLKITWYANESSK